MAEEVRNMIEQLGLEEKRNAQSSTLSGGMSNFFKYIVRWIGNDEISSYRTKEKIMCWHGSYWWIKDCFP